ncbi:TMV resistance protein N-like [Quercus robur]|uniref:TMV resistance protein N-like n=1 Tax=Quercus robur TaxID=38942 RepID=UPI00216207C0|nr:TMV resistance protein N-like [Quercus robur]
MSSTSIQTVPTSFPSSSKPHPEYDVFLSFRGEDTRIIFTDHLYYALTDQGIITFKDDKELDKGKPISPELLDAIEKSRVAVIILSKMYASSSWCLEELAKIVECMKEGGLIILPIFYHVDPSHVRHQRDTFEEAFANHEVNFQENPDKVQKWRVALTTVANLAGHHLKDGASEAEFIRNIVPWIYSKLNYKSRKVVEGNLVGIASRVEEIISCLQMELTHDALFIGISGMSGMGKSTLAQVVFDKIHDQFDASSFLKILGEDSIDKPGLLTLQERLLSDICRKDIRPRKLSTGIQVISNNLRNKKVLIVVDDVSEESQLENLVGKPDSNCLHPGGRVIVTTENKHMLAICGIGRECMAKGLNNDEALQLFCLKAFHKPHCENNFLDLCNNFVYYAQGIPLVLEVWGSHLCKRTKKEWESAWNKLKAIPLGKTTKKLGIAVNGLEDSERELFLDIACFFIGEDENRVADILESVHHFQIDKSTLMDRSLITIVGGKLWTHNLLQEVGWEIIRAESKKPEKRSRLGFPDVLDVLKSNTGTKHIKGIVLKEPLDEEEESNKLNAESFSKMTKLILLKFCKVHLPCLSFLSNELRLLEWHDYPLQSLPKSFKPRKLVELIMHRSCIQKLPGEFRNLYKLKLIDLSDSQNLTQTPDFSGFSNIERLNFQGCTRLHELHPSVGGLKQLIQLNLKDCKCLENLPHELNLESLKILILSSCSKLNKFPEIGSNMTSLLELYLDGTAIEELPSSIKHLTCLDLLNLQDCKNLLSFPSIICSLTSLEFLTLSGCKGQQPIEALSYTGPEPEPRNPVPEPTNLLLPSSFSGLGSLVSLDLSDCNLSDGELPDDLSCLSSLKSLNLSKNNFTNLPDSISELSELKLILLDHCSQLKSLPYLPLSTQYVSARGCSSLENYSNQVVVWTSGDAGFTFINCLGLADDEEGKIAEISLLDIHFQPLWQRFMEEQIHQIEGFYSVVPQTELPDWFNHQSSKSSVDSVPIQLPPNLFENKSWKGTALCVIFEVKNLKDVSPGQDSKRFHEFICRLDVDGGLKDSRLVYNIPKEKFHGGSFGLWLFISHKRFRECLDERSCISPLIKTNSQDIEIKMCGARVLYETDMAEFVEKISQETFGSPDDLCLREKKFITYHMANSHYVDEVESSQSNGQNQSNPRLKTQFKSLLSKLYQVDLARNHWYDYIFPQIARPPHWFSYQNFGPYIKMELPPDLHDNSRWLGFTVYALYTIGKQGDAFSYKQDSTNSTILLRFSSLSASDEVSFAPYTAFPLSRDIFGESSQRLLVFYIPRLLFGMNRCSHIGALFESNNPGVQIGMCGIRLVYEKNVEEFVQTLVEYMLGTPEVYHQAIYLNLIDQLGKLQGCNHGEDFCCTFTPERRPHAMHMPKLLPSNAIQEKIQEMCTPEIHSNAVGTSRNSDRSPIYLGIPFFNGQCGSKMSSSLESWFKPYLQDHYNKRSIFNHCFPQSKIPEWFSHQSTNRSSVRMWLPPDLYDNPDWMGFAFCAVFSFHKHPTSVWKNLNSEFAHIFSCHLKTNLGCMSPLLYYGIDEDDVLISLHQRAFIWVSFMPRVILSPHWRQCTWVEFSFLSGSPDVSPLKCAVDLLYKQNLQEFTCTMVQCVISYVDYLYVIRGSCKKAVYERLPFYGSDEFSGSDSLYEDLDCPYLPVSQGETSGTSSQYSYEDSLFYKTGALVKISILYIVYVYLVQM